MVYSVRERCGRQLAIEAPVKLSSDESCDALTTNEARSASSVSYVSSDLIVAPIPETSIPAALGYAKQANLPYVEVFCKNRYVGQYLNKNRNGHMWFDMHNN